MITTAITRGASAPGVIRGFAPYTLGRGTDAILFIHGIAGGPAHYREMAEFAADRGYTARGTLLPGHGTRTRDLAHVTWLDWFEHCVKELSELRAGHERVHVVAYSIGAALALELAAAEHVDRMVLMSVPMNPWRSLTLLRLAFGVISPVMPRLHGRPPRFIDDTGEEFYYVYRTTPSRINGTMIDLLHRARRTVLRVETPTMIIQSKTDKSVGAASGPWTYRKLAARDKRMYFVENSDHAVMLDDSRYDVFEQSLGFLAAGPVEDQPRANRHRETYAHV